MAEQSAIEWTDSTFNPWIGCTKVSPACDDCYAARSTPARTMGIVWGPGQERQRTSASNWRQPLLWEREHEAFMLAHGRRRRVFCASLADVFDNEVPSAWRDELMGLIATTPHLDWLLLTKRIGNVQAMLKHDAWQHLSNVWLGATVVSQGEADRDIPKLLAVPARVRFLSIEPMLGPIDISRFMWPVHPRWPSRFRSPEDAIAAGEKVTYHRQGLISADWARNLVSWVIAGGESGPKARPAHPDWLRSLRDQCAAAGVPFMFKQWGEHTAGELAPNPAYPDDAVSAWRLDQRGQRWHDPVEGLKAPGEWAPLKFLKVGKKAAGRLLDGALHDEWPPAVA